MRIFPMLRSNNGGYGWGLGYEVAELAKVYENTFRMVNVAPANELAQICARLNLDVWQVIDAAASKPFGFMKSMPGPGLGRLLHST